MKLTSGSPGSFARTFEHRADVLEIFLADVAGVFGAYDQTAYRACDETAEILSCLSQQDTR